MTLILLRYQRSPRRGQATTKNAHEPAFFYRCFPSFSLFFFFFFLLSFFFLLFILPFYSEFIPCFCFGSCLFDKLSRAFEKDKVKVSFFSEFLFFFFILFIYLFIFIFFFFHFFGI